jgi:CYTH domain-containing protein
MGKEIERKFLVEGDAWRSLGEGTRYRQGYLSTVKERAVRVRTIAEEGYLTIKGVSIGIARAEWSSNARFRWRMPARCSTASASGP